MKMIVKKWNIYVYVWLFIFLPPYYINNIYYNPIRFARALLAIISIFKIAPYIIKKGGTKQQIAVILFCISMVISTVHATSERSRIAYSLIESLTILEIFAFWEKAQKKYWWSFICLARYIIFWVLLNTVTLVLFPNGLFQNSLGNPLWVLGGKFEITYYNLVCIAFCVSFFKMKKKKERDQLLIILGLLCINLSIEIFVGCSTGIIATFLLMIMFGYVENRKKIKLKYAIVITAVLTIAVVFLQIQKNIPLLRYVIEDLLQKNISLTGRNKIYESYFRLMRGNMIWGMGYKNTLIQDYIGPANTQNAFLELLCLYGIVGLILFLLVFSISVREYRNKYIYLKSIAAMIIIYFVCAVVEIPFDNLFYILVALIAKSADIQLEIEKQLEKK